eukprot:1861812-Rhodomonas_salina.2
MLAYSYTVLRVLDFPVSLPGATTCTRVPGILSLSGPQAGLRGPGMAIAGRRPPMNCRNCRNSVRPCHDSELARCGLPS